MNMNIKDKKGLSRIITVVLMFGFLAFFFLLATFGFKALFQDEILTPVTGMVVGIANQTSMSTTNIETLENMSAPYYLDFLNLDLLFLVFVIGMFIATLLAANKARKVGIYSFFGLVTIGSAAFLFILRFFERIRVWLFENVLYNVFNLEQFSTPIVNYFVNNIQWITLVWILLILIVNQLDIIKTIGLNRASEEGRIEE